MPHDLQRPFSRLDAALHEALIFGGAARGTVISDSCIKCALRIRIGAQFQLQWRWRRLDAAYSRHGLTCSVCTSRFERSQGGARHGNDETFT